MNEKKEKLCEYLKARKYLELEEHIDRATKDGKPAASREKKLLVNAIKRFQTFSGLRPTGRANALTLEETAKPRCGSPDLASHELLFFAAALPPRWNPPSVTYGFRNFTSQLTRDEIKDTVRAAFGEWQRAAQRITFREVPMSANPLIVILFAGTGNHGDNREFSPGDRHYAHAFPPNDPFLPGDIHFDNTERWTLDDDPARIDFFTAALHEIGHAFGLVEHSLNSHAVMYAEYERPRRTLHPEDEARIQALYP